MLCFQTSPRLSFSCKNQHRLHCACTQRCRPKHRDVVLMSTRPVISKPILMFITPDGFRKDVDKAISISKAVLVNQATFIQIRDGQSTLEEIQLFTKELLSSGIPARNIVLNGLNPKDVYSIHQNLSVHIKEKDISRYLPVVKAIQPTSLVGCAVHNTETARRILDILRPDYMQIGTMFATKSHPGKVPEGPDLLLAIRKLVGRTTALIGVGGVTEKNASTLIEKGADGVAVIRYLADADDPYIRATALTKSLQETTGRIS